MPLDLQREPRRETLHVRPVVAHGGEVLGEGDADAWRRGAGVHVVGEDAEAERLAQARELVGGDAGSEPVGQARGAQRGLAPVGGLQRLRHDQERLGAAGVGEA